MADSSLSDLRQALREAGPPAWAACRALAAMGDEASLDCLLGLSRAPDWRLRRAAIEALAGHALADRCAPDLAAALGDASPYVVRTACEAVGQRAILAARPAIARLAHGPDPATREAALRAWASLWRVEDFEPVLGIHRRDPVERVRREAAGLLMRQADAANWWRLFEPWSTAPFGRHRRWACELAGRFGGAGAVPAALQGLLHDTDGHVRKAAARALAGLAPGTAPAGR